MNGTNVNNKLTKGKKLNVFDYVALYKMSLRSFFWRVDGRQAMNAWNNRNMFSLAIWFFFAMISYGLPGIFIFSVISFLQALLLTPLRWIIPALNVMHPGIFIGWMIMSGILMLIFSPAVLNKERLNYNLHFTDSAWWRNTGITPSQIIKDRGMYGEYIATMAAEENMKKYGLYGQVFNSVIIPKADGSFNEADVICVNEAGIQVIEAKYRGGAFIGGLTSESWTQKIGRQTNENVDNPLYQNNGHINCLINHLYRSLPEGRARMKAAFPYSYVNVSLLTNMECDLSQLDDSAAPAQFFLGPAEGNNGYIDLDIKSMYGRSFSKQEVDEICAELEKISGYTHAYIQNLVQQRKRDKDLGVYKYKYFYSLVCLESATSDGDTELNELICQEVYDWKHHDWADNNPAGKTCVFRYYMDPKDRMFKAIPDSRIQKQSARTRNLKEIQAYYSETRKG